MILNKSTSVIRIGGVMINIKLKEHKADLEAKVSLKDIIAKIDEADMQVRQLIEEIINESSTGHLTESCSLLDLLRSEADLQSAITQLRGSY
jgi:hypothetical protein